MKTVTLKEMANHATKKKKSTLNRTSPPETRQAKLTMEEAKAKEANATCTKADNTPEILAAINSLRAEVTTRNDELMVPISEIKTDLMDKLVTTLTEKIETGDPICALWVSQRARRAERWKLFWKNGYQRYSQPKTSQPW